MFGKLLKYEFKAVGKWYLGLYAAAGLLSVIVGFWIQNLINRRGDSALSNYSDTYQFGANIEGIFFVTVMIAFVIIIVSLFLSTLFLIVNRFRKNVYGRQGYLTMTLPVTNHQIILSKLTAAFVWNTLSGITALLCILITILIASVPHSDLSLDSVLHYVGQAFKAFTGLDSILYFILFFTINTINSILLIYFAISLGQLFKDHRTLLAVVFYFGINIAETILGGILAIVTATFYTPENVYHDRIFNFYDFPLLILTALLAVGYYFGTNYIMTKKLNLQ